MDVNLIPASEILDLTPSSRLNKLKYIGLGILCLFILLFNGNESI